MDKVKEYRSRAEECRRMGKVVASSDVQRQYEELAAMWDRMADERVTFFVPRDQSGEPVKEQSKS